MGLMRRDDLARGRPADHRREAEPRSDEAVRPLDRQGQGLPLLPANAGYYIAEDFSFTFATDDTAPGRSSRASRRRSRRGASAPPTPASTWTGPSNPRVRVLGVKAIDRLPPKFRDYKLDPDKILTALIVEVWSGDRWRPWFINNWFHKWGTPADSALILSHYVDRPSPSFDVYGFKGDITADLNERSRKLGREASRTGVPITAASSPTRRRSTAGRLDLLHVFVKNEQTGGHDASGRSQGSDSVDAAGPGDVGPGLADDLQRPPPPQRRRYGAGSAAQGQMDICRREGVCRLARGGRWPCLLRQQRSAALLRRCDHRQEVLGVRYRRPGGINASRGRQARVVFGSFDGKVYCLDAVSGKERWRFTTGPRIAGFSGIDDVKQGVDSSAAVVDDRVYFGAWDGKAYCLDLNTGKESGRSRTRGRSTTARPRWPAAGSSSAAPTAPSTAGTRDRQGDLGERRWPSKHSDHMMSSPAVQNGVVYVGSGYDGPLFALDAASGAESLNVAASIFMGQTEAPLTIRPFLPDLTQSELMTIMTSGMAHVSGGIMAAYIAFGVEARHLLTAVIMTAPGTLLDFENAGAGDGAAEDHGRRAHGTCRARLELSCGALRAGRAKGWAWPSMWERC